MVVEGEPKQSNSNPVSESDSTCIKLIKINSHTVSEHKNTRTDSVHPTESTKAITPVKSNPKEVREVIVDIEREPKTLKANTIPEVLCPFCRLMSKNLNSLKIHIENIHNNSRTVPSMETGDNIISKGNETVSECPHCEFLGTRSSIENHISKKHGYIIICGECGNTFSDTKTCEEHIEAMHLLPQQCEPFPCEQCGLVMSNYFSLQDHLQQFHNNTNKCMKCDFVPRNTEELRQHKQTEHQTIRVDILKQDMGTEQFLAPSCSLCEYKYKLNIQLVQHMKKKHEPVIDKKYKCSSCAFQSDYLIKMYEHRLSVHPETPIGFSPKSTSAKDMAINLIAEQNMEIMEEVLDMKKGVISSFEKLSEEMRENYDLFVSEAKRKDAIAAERIKALEDKIEAGFKDKSKSKHESSESAGQSVGSKSPSSPPPPPTQPLPTPPPSSDVPRRPAHFNKGKTMHLQKPKVLYIGDSVAHNVNFASLEKKTNSRIKTVKAYSSVRDSRARWPAKNVTDVTPAALVDTPDHDEFSHLVLGAPNVDISNMNTNKLVEEDNIEA